MTHAEWVAEIKNEIGLKAAVRDVSRLKRLAARALRSANVNAGEWHAEQALSLAASLLADQGRHREAASLFRRCVKMQKGMLLYFGHAAASSLAMAADELFKAKAHREAAALAKQALHYFGKYPEPNVFLEALMGPWRAYELRHRAGKPNPAGPAH